MMQANSLLIPAENIEKQNKKVTLVSPETQNKIETVTIDRIESYMSFNDLTEEGFNSRPSRNVRPVKKIILIQTDIENSCC